MNSLTMISKVRFAEKKYAQVSTLVQITTFFYFSGNSRRLSGHGKRHMGLQITHV